MDKEREDRFKGLDARNALIEAGVELIAERGYDGASVGDITQLAQVSKGAFYYHFESKEEFVLMTIKERAEKNTERFRQLIEANSSVSQWIENSFSIIIGFPAADPIWPQFSAEVMVAGMRPGHSRIGKEFAAIHEQWRSLLIEMIKNSNEYEEGLICCEPDVIAVAIMSLVDGFLMHLQLEEGFFTSERFGERLAPLLKLWVAPAEEALG